MHIRAMQAWRTRGINRTSAHSLILKTTRHCNASCDENRKRGSYARSCTNRPLQRPLRATTRAYQAFAAASPSPASDPPLAPRLAQFVDDNFIPLALLAAATFGWFIPTPGTIAHSYKVQKFSTIGQFVISGLVLQASQVIAALKSPFPILYGVLSILFVTPLLGILVMSLPASLVQPFEFKVGMAVFCCVPTTLSSCVALTNQCNGNAAIALLLVVLTAILGVFTIPTVLGFVLGGISGSGLGPGAFNQFELLKTLVLTVMCPLFFGMSLQRIGGISAWKDVKTNRKLLARLSTMFLCITPWLQLSVASSAALALTPRLIATGVGLGIGVHCAMLAFNMAATSVVRFSRRREEHIAIRKALVLCGSEKTLPVAVAVIGQLGVLGAGGGAFAILPCIFSHIIQTVIDSGLVGRWNAVESKRL